MALRLEPPCRTQGDGMEKPENELPVEHTIVLQPRILKSPTELGNKITVNSSLANTNVKSSQLVVKLTPQTVNKKKKLLINLKNKEPKFVPYEPYKAAVNPIVAEEKKNFRQPPRTKSKDIPAIFKPNKNVDKDDKKADKAFEPTCENEISNVDWKAKSISLELELQTLKEENEQLENQLKFQVQVNGELKNLLVAAVGEDMETKVHVLTEDKLHLAQALLKSAKSLSSHQEQMEWLAGQCEVWRSKFLASSVMVEELARWKAGLTQKVSEAQDALKKLLEERKYVRRNLCNIYNNLNQLKNNFDLLNKKKKLPSGNVLDLSDENWRISESLVIQLLGADKVEYNAKDITEDLSKETAAEKTAEHIVANPHLLQLFGEPDAACNAVVGAAVELSGQLYLQCHPPRIGCCAQCSGEIKLV